MTEKKISIGNLDVNYKTAGEGESLLILHGWGGSSDSWLEVQEILSKKGLKVIVPDFPGFGKSKTPPKIWGLKEYSDFIFDFAQTLGLESFFLLGHSFGGRIAVKFTLLHPEKIKKLILCDSAGIKPKPGLKTRMIFMLARMGNAVFTPKILARFKDGARNLFYVFLRNKDYVKARGNMKEVIRNVIGEDLLPELPLLRTGVLLIWGEIDKLVPLKYGRIFREKIPGAKLIVLPKIGHSPHLEAPSDLAGIILNFIQGKNA
jgi:pimeloyl-ACP methyl ester carboxylesterase